MLGIVGSTVLAQVVITLRFAILDTGRLCANQDRMGQDLCCYKEEPYHHRVL